MNKYDQVLVSEPSDDDNWSHGFEGTVIEVDGYFAIVRDQDDDCFTVTLNKLTLLEN